MNLLICFVLILATYYRFGTACSPNSVEIHNQLGPDIILHFHCRCKNPKCDVGNQQFGTTCSWNHVDIHNQFGLDNVLQYHYRCKNPKCDLKPMN
ncbi:hypothetical protein HID58_053525 [Brassica napus]|uniref:S-protein homolog n=1 Tax=Brassica napus TaxID=3708 RepID=A0ABQ8AG88_BRANA|nr:hypothetical protein HID58_053525 [Brassica napus]